MLSPLLLVSDRRLMQPDFLSALQAALEGGARFIQLRENDLSSDELQNLARDAARLCADYAATLVINSHLLIAHELNIGVHWPERFLDDTAFEYSFYLQTRLCGFSVHSVQNAQRAQDLGADYVVFGSIFPTSSHPGQKPQGTNQLREVVQSVALPVFAIGGIEDERAIQRCFDVGAHGVAMRSAIWNAPDVKHKVEEVLYKMQN